MPTATVSSKGRVTIPKAVREILSEGWVGPRGAKDLRPSNTRICAAILRAHPSHHPLARDDSWAVWALDNERRNTADFCLGNFFTPFRGEESPAQIPLPDSAAAMLEKSTRMSSQRVQEHM